MVSERSLLGLVVPELKSTVDRHSEKRGTASHRRNTYNPYHQVLYIPHGEELGTTAPQSRGAHCRTAEGSCEKRLLDL